MEALIAIIPTLGVAGLFFLVMRAIFRADRNERNALAELEKRAMKNTGKNLRETPL